MRCKACDVSIEPRTRSVQDELGHTHSMDEELCGYCVVQSQMKYSEDDLRDIYSGVLYANFQVIR
jgi:hypothetical protein